MNTEEIQEQEQELKIFNTNEDLTENEIFNKMLNSYGVNTLITQKNNEINNIGKKCIDLLSDFKNRTKELKASEKYTDEYKKEIEKKETSEVRQMLFNYIREQKQVLKDVKKIELEYWDNQLRKSYQVDSLNKINGNDLQYIELLLNRAISKYKNKIETSFLNANKKAINYNDEKEKNQDSKYLTKTQIKKLTEVKRKIAERYNYNHAVLEILNIDGLTENILHPLEYKKRQQIQYYNVTGINSDAFSFNNKIYYVNREINNIKNGGKVI